MSFIKKYYEYGVVGIIGVLVFFITRGNNTDLDMYFHIKAGEIFVQKGIIFHDVFSHSAYGRLWIPYEWLFQVGIYYIVHFFSLSSLGVLVGVLSAIQILFFYIFLRKMWDIHPFLSFLICIFYTYGIYFFLVPRPTLIANLFFIVTAGVILLYVFKDKNYLWITIPVYLLWINIHASFIMLIFWAISYAGVSFILWKITKQSEWIKKSKTLAIYGIAYILLSFSPPLWGLQYVLLSLFFLHASIVSYVAEWLPLIDDIPGFIIYTFIASFVLISLVTIMRKRFLSQRTFLLVPIFVLFGITYLADRNLLYGVFALSIIFSFIFSQTQKLFNKTIIIWYDTFLIILILGGISLYAYLITITYSPSRFYPIQATSFILSSGLRGNMYNDYNYGGYLLYRLYPQQKVFIDGRTDVFLCCELTYVQQLDQQPPLPEEQYRKLFLSVLDKYHFSFVLITRTVNSLEKMNVLYNSSNWVLVFWDDTSQIFVRKNDLNNPIIKKFGAAAVFPYAPKLFDKNHLLQAELEVRRMISIADSAKSRDILGVILLEERKQDQAIEEFKKAIEINPSYTPPYLNLAFLLAEQGNYEGSRLLYERALYLGATDDSLYIYLGEVYIKENNIKEAINIWQKGLQTVRNEQSRQKLNLLLHSF